MLVNQPFHTRKDSIRGKDSKRKQMGFTELSELTIQNCLTICTLLLSRHKKKQF